MKVKIIEEYKSRVGQDRKEVSDRSIMVKAICEKMVRLHVI